MQALALYEAAARARHEGRHAEARRLVSLFLLRQGELQAKDRERLVPLANRLLGLAFHGEWGGDPAAAAGVIAEPAFRFEDELR
jgi:hypothetical protein